ncbi:unnamed protein product [Mytilus edulis]|uniref:PHD-type domain-containing protein n=1 Tax=Mytilus edulis TaxID=6550 RepID=A0A8S3QFY7_MYTED|nr:unnamed protein product [Mytilus edulis]
MEIARRRDERGKIKRSVYTPAKPARKVVFVASSNDKSSNASCTRTTDINTSIQQDQYQQSKQNSASESLKSLINASDQQQNDYCPTCENLCSSGDKAVECEICNKWLHYKCENLTVKEADEIENNLSLQYNCNSCKTLKSLQLYSCAEKTPATYELFSTKETYVPPSSDKTSESCPSTKCPSTIPSDPKISDPESTISPIESVKNLTTHLLNILSFNIEGLTSNLVYLYKLIKQFDIILLQEHWLYSHEKDNLYTNFTDFNYHIKCFDDGIIDDVVDRKPGYAGFAICVNNKYSPYVCDSRVLRGIHKPKLPDGGNRIAAIRLNFDVPLVIISVYLPSRSNNYSRDDYLSVLDELIEIVTKYRDSANILIGGDMNASIFRNHPRDNDFKNFLRNNNLRIPVNCIELKITEIDNLSIENFDEFVISVCEIITQTADSLQPPNSRKRGKNSRYWTPNMTDILNRSKYHYWMWKQEGTSDKLSIHYQQMRVF